MGSNTPEVCAGTCSSATDSLLDARDWWERMGMVLVLPLPTLKDMLKQQQLTAQSGAWVGEGGRERHGRLNLEGRGMGGQTWGFNRWGRVDVPRSSGP